VTVVELGEVVSVRSSLVDPRRADFQHFPLIAPDSIERDTGRLLEYESVSQSGVTSGKYRFESGDVLYSKIRPYLNKVVLVDFAGLCSADMYALAVNPAKIISDYFVHLLRSPEFLAYTSRLSNRANIPKLNREQLTRFRFDLPSIDAQRRIVAILGEADTLRAKRRLVVQKIGELTRAVFNDMFGGQPVDQKLGDGCLRVTDGTHQSPQWSDSGVPFLFVSNIVSGQIDFDTKKYISVDTWRELTQRSPIDVGDVLYSTVGTYGVPAVVRSSRQFAFQRHIAHIKPNPKIFEPEFLGAMLGSPIVKRQADRVARGVAQPTVNLSDIKKFDVIIPPLNEQKEFAARLESIYELRRCADRAAKMHADLYTSLRARAFHDKV
jgi:type I restriction enzyme S subunit